MSNKNQQHNLIQIWLTCARCSGNENGSSGNLSLFDHLKNNAGGSSGTGLSNQT
jgi:hypothetical protein